jgi:acyl-CoA hydrolase
MTTRQRRAQITEVVFPDRANHYGTLFGGQALNLLAKAAFVAARGFARRDVVMARCSDAQFHAPVRVGSVLLLDAQVMRVGRSSLTVHVTGFADELVAGSPAVALEGAFEMVAVDAAGRPSPMTGVEHCDHDELKASA